MGDRRSSGEIVRLAEYQVDRATVDFPQDTGSHASISNALPSKIGRYTVLDLLGVGGMGVVCTAYDPKLDRKVALKLLRHKKKDDGRTSTGQARLIREAQSLAKLSHPNIITVHDVDRFEDRVYMAMEFIDGTSLDRWMVREQREWRAVIGVFVDAAKGLAAAHEAGIIHRDFKPANVLIGKDGRVLVVDFGLAKSNDLDDKSGAHSSAPADLLRERSDLMDALGSTVDSKLTQVGRTVGTPAYMAPEQFLGLAVGPQTDQFSFGVALFEALYGYLPFPDESRDELIERVTGGRVSDPPKDTTVPGWVHRVVLHTLQTRPGDRYPSMNAVIAALQADPAKRRRRVFAGAGGLVLLGLASYGAVRGLTPDAALCSGAEARMAEIWNPARKDQIRSAFVATERPYALDAWTRVEEELDERAAEWTSVHRAVCEATNVRKDQSTALMDVRMACLDRRHRQMGALIEVFADPDDKVVQEAIEAAQSVEDIDGCRNLREEGHGLAIVDPAMRERADVIESKLARSKAQSTAGRPEPALAQATQALALARELGHRPLLARAALEHARLIMEQATEPEQIHDHVVEAIKLAAETEQAPLEADAWSLLIALDGGRPGGLERALALRLPAEMALARADDLRVQGAYDLALGTVLAKNGQPEAALESMGQALESYRSALGDHHTKVAATLSNLGAQYARMGLNDEARHYLGDAAKTVEQIYGPHHPLLGSIRINLGGVWFNSGDYEAAHAEYLRAEEIFRKSMPIGHPRTLRAMVGLAQTEQVSDPERAARRFEEVLATIRGQKDPDLDTMASTYNSLGFLQRRQAAAREAEAAGAPPSADVVELRDKAFDNFTRSLATYAALDGDRTRLAQVTLVRLNLCLLEVDRKRPKEAMALCKAAWELQRDANAINPHGVEALQELAVLHSSLGDERAALAVLAEGVASTPIERSVPLRIALADRQWNDVATRPEAIALVREAQIELRDSPPSAAVRDELDRWLRQHP